MSGPASRRQARPAPGAPAGRLVRGMADRRYDRGTNLTIVNCAGS